MENLLLCFLQKRIENLKAEQKTVKDQMAMADDELQKTEDLVKMLADSKTVSLTICSLDVLLFKWTGALSYHFDILQLCCK